MSFFSEISSLQPPSRQQTTLNTNIHLKHTANNHTNIMENLPADHFVSRYDLSQHDIMCQMQMTLGATRNLSR